MIFYSSMADEQMGILMNPAMFTDERRRPWVLSPHRTFLFFGMAPSLQLSLILVTQYRHLYKAVVEVMKDNIPVQVQRTALGR